MNSVERHQLLSVPQVRPQTAEVCLHSTTRLLTVIVINGVLVWCGVVWCGVVWCGVVWCGVVWCGVVWCGVVWCGVVWCGVVWCGVVWCGVVWCGVVWCAEGAVTRRQWPGCLPTGTGKREGCVLVCCCTAGTSAQSHLAGAALPTPVHSHTGSSGPTAPCVLHCTISTLCAVLHCLVLCTALHCVCPAALHLWAVDSGQCNSCNALPHCLGAVGSATPATHCHTAWGQWAVELLQRTASLPGGSGQWNSCVHLLVVICACVAFLTARLRLSCRAFVCLFA